MGPQSVPREQQVAWEVLVGSKELKMKVKEKSEMRDPPTACCLVGCCPEWYPGSGASLGTSIDNGRWKAAAPLLILPPLLSLGEQPPWAKGGGMD